MLEPQKVDGGEGWRSQRGELSLWRPSDTVLVIRVQGHGEAAFAPLIIAGFDELAASAQSGLFFEMEGMQTYDSPLRTELTHHFVRERGRIRTIHVLSRSKIVNMGVAVANLALGNIKTYPSRAQFAAALDRALGQEGVASFAGRVGLKTTAA